MLNTYKSSTSTWSSTCAAAALLLPGVAVMAADPAPVVGWETSANLGASVTRGNSKTLLFTAGVLSQKKWDNNEVRLGLDGAYGENNSVKSTEFGRVFGQYNRLFNERLYGYLRAEVSHDAIAAIDYRVTLSPGIGYYFIKDARQALSVEVGPGFVHEKLHGAGSKNYFALRVAERYDLKLNDKTRIWQSAEWLPQIDDLNNWILNTEIGLETQLTPKMSFRTYIQDSYDNEPVLGRQKNDLKLVAGIAYKF